MVWYGTSDQGSIKSLSQLVRLRLQAILDGFNVETAALVRIGSNGENPRILGAAGQADDLEVTDLAKAGAYCLHGAQSNGKHVWGTTLVEGRVLYSGLAEPALGGLLIALAMMPDDGAPLAMPQALILMMSYLVTEVGSSAPLDVSLMAGMPWAAALIDSSALVLFMNERAKCVARRHPQIDIRQGQLHLRRSAIDRTLHRLVGEVARHERPRAVVPVPDRTGAVTLALHLESLPQSSIFAKGQGAHRAIAYLIELRTFSAPDRHALASLFSLSSKEARLAELLCRGLRLDAASQVMGISRNTAKIHLRHVLEKTGTSGQVDLARLLSQLPDGHGQPDPAVAPLEDRHQLSRTS